MYALAKSSSVGVGSSFALCFLKIGIAFQNRVCYNPSEGTTSNGQPLLLNEVIAQLARVGGDHFFLFAKNRPIMPTIKMPI